MTDRLRIGLSTCPNDTFAFHALMAGRVDARGLDLEFVLADVEELNERMLAGELDAAKVSFAAALAMSERVAILSAGSALGVGVGPVVLASPGKRAAPASRVLAPGKWTTAALLWRLFHADEARPEHVVFSAILPALERGQADLGVCIHEARFTYAERGLALVEDLGQRWEQATGLPLPLGGIAARRGLGAGALATLALAIRDSIAWGQAHRAECLPTMRAHAQETRDEVLWKHVELYVNAHTLDLGPEGRAALDELATAGGEAAGGSIGVPPARLEIVEARQERLFHIAPAAAWESRGEPEWRPPSLASEGFVHLSFAAQLAGTLAAHFGGVERVALVELEPERLRGALRLERSRGGELFPHVYRGLQASDVRDVRVLDRARPASERLA